MSDAFPLGTVRSLEAAKPAECFGVIDRSLDEGHGSERLCAPTVGADLWAELYGSDVADCEVLAHHVAATHIHVLIREGEAFDLETTVERWKAAALSDPRCRWIPDRRFWAPGYFDAWLEDPAEIEAARLAIESHGSAPRRSWSWR
jgi:hypothetical protein